MKTILSFAVILFVAIIYTQHFQQDDKKEKQHLQQEVAATPTYNSRKPVSTHKSSASVVNQSHAKPEEVYPMTADQFELIYGAMIQGEQIEDCSVATTNDSIAITFEDIDCSIIAENGRLTITKGEMSVCVDSTGKLVRGSEHNENLQSVVTSIQSRLADPD